MTIAEKLDRKCWELFGEFPFSIQEVGLLSAIGNSYEDMLYKAAWKFYTKERERFSQAIFEWSEGIKPEVTLEEAKTRNQRFKNAQRIIDERISTMGDTLIDWEAFPNDDPSIVFFMGYPWECKICRWADNYKKVA